MSKGQMFFSNSGGSRGCGRGGRGRFGQGWGGQGLTYENNSQFQQENRNTRGTFGRRGSFHAKQGRQIRPVTSNYCGKIGHREEDCWKKRSEPTSTSRKVTNYATNSEFEDYGGMFVTRHKANTMSASSSASTSTSKEVWFIDSGALNHMTSHEEWFSYLHTPNRPGYVETINDITHTIRHIGNVPLSMANNNCIRNVLHIPTITKNLVSVSLIMEQGM